MKTRCPHCSFKFDTDENITPPFRQGQKVRFIKAHVDASPHGGDFGYYLESFDFTGKVIDQKLIRAKDICDWDKYVRGKDSWMVKVQFVPCGTRNRCVQFDFWAYQLQAITKQQGSKRCSI